MLKRLNHTSAVTVARRIQSPLPCFYGAVKLSVRYFTASSSGGDRDHTGEGLPGTTPTNPPRTSADKLNAAQERHHARDLKPSKPSLEQSCASAADFMMWNMFEYFFGPFSGSFDEVQLYFLQDMQYAYAGSDDGRVEDLEQQQVSNTGQAEVKVATQGGPAIGSPTTDDEICGGEQKTSGAAGLEGPETDAASLRMRLPHVLAMSVLSFASDRTCVITRSGPKGGANDIERHKETSLRPPSTQCGTPIRTTPADPGSRFITSGEDIDKGHPGAGMSSSSSSGGGGVVISPTAGAAVGPSAPGDTSRGGYEDELDTGKVTFDKSIHIRLAEEAQMKMHSDHVLHAQHAPDGSAYTRTYHPETGYMGTARAVAASEAGARAGMQVEPPSMAEHHHDQGGDTAKDHKQGAGPDHAMP